ncbi:hypothetical protein GCM10027341_15910 [Spirosoma knui]
MKHIGLLMGALLLVGKCWACYCGTPPPLTKEILSRYPYVALVKIRTMHDLLRPVGNRKRLGREGKFTVDVIENFGKALPDTFVLQGYRTSCDIGLRPGQTWVIFAKVLNGQATVFACDYSIQYAEKQEISDSENLRSQAGEELLNTVRQLSGRPIKATNGRIEKFYLSGRRALLTTYIRGGREERTVWHKNGRLWGREFYKKGLKNGPATWWNANGTLLSTETFVAGIAVDTSRYWYRTDVDSTFYLTTATVTSHERDSILLFYSQSHLQRVTIADRQGRLLSSRNYDWYGRLTDETVGVPETGVECRTAYDKQGNVNFLIVTRTEVKPHEEPIPQIVYRIDYDKDGSRQVTYYDTKGRLTRWVQIKEGRETILEEKRYLD